MKKDLKIFCKGISDITPRTYEMDVSLEECSLGFISDISGQDIVENCNDIDDILKAIDFEYLYGYVKERA